MLSNKRLLKRSCYEELPALTRNKPRLSSVPPSDSVKCSGSIGVEDDRHDNEASELSQSSVRAYTCGLQVTCARSAASTS